MINARLVKFDLFFKEIFLTTFHIFKIICICENQTPKTHNWVSIIQFKEKASTNSLESLCVPSQLYHPFPHIVFLQPPTKRYPLFWIGLRIWFWPFHWNYTNNLVICVSEMFGNGISIKCLISFLHYHTLRQTLTDVRSSSSFVCFAVNV